MLDAQFQSTPSGRKATPVVAGIANPYGFNPRLPGGRRPSSRKCCAPAMGFNPRLPGGRRHRSAIPSASPRQFQSTPSGRKATIIRNEHHETVSFNPRLPGGRRLAGYVLPPCCKSVSIHAFREEGDGDGGLVRVELILRFQSTPSGRKATRRLRRKRGLYPVSIHAFREEGDGH